MKSSPSPSRLDWFVVQVADWGLAFAGVSDSAEALPAKTTIEVHDETVRLMFRGCRNGFSNPGPFTSRIRTKNDGALAAICLFQPSVPIGNQLREAHGQEINMRHSIMPRTSQGNSTKRRHLPVPCCSTTRTRRHNRTVVQ